MGSLLDSLYGVLVQPGATFAQLRQKPQVTEAALIVLLVNALGTSDLSPTSLLAAALAGGMGWLTLNGILWLLAYSLGRDPCWSGLLTLTGYASVPWLLWSPAQAWGPVVGGVLGLGVGVWLGVWQLWAASVALGIPVQRWGWVVVLPFLGVGVGMTWLGNVLGLLLSLG
ncbi:MAG: YIP1 family protein [Thermostichales cyanobacterium DRC_bins_46]